MELGNKIKVFSTLILLIGIGFSSSAQFIPEDKDALNRIVKNRIKTEYIYRNGELEYVNQYAPNGRKILFEKYGKGGVRLIRYKWELDSLGRRVRGEFFVGDSLMRRHVYIYDLKGNCVEALKNETKEGFLERGYHYSYNKSNQLVLEEHVLLDGTVDTRFEYKYNTSGKMSEEFIFKGMDTQGKRITFSYYDTGLLKESILYEKDGSLTLKYVAEYDVKKNLVKGLSYQFDQMKIRDEKGNLIKGTEYQGEHI